MRNIKVIPFAAALFLLMISFILISFWYIWMNADWKCFGILIAGVIFGIIGALLSLSKRKRIARSLSVIGIVSISFSSVPGNSDLIPSLSGGAGDLWAGAGLLGGALLLLVLFLEISWTIPSMKEGNEGRHVRSYLISLLPATTAVAVFILGLSGLVHISLNALPEHLFYSIEAGSVVPVFILGMIMLGFLLIIFTIEVLILKLIRT